MYKRNYLFTIALVGMFSLTGWTLPAQDAPQKLDSAYQWGIEKFESEIADVEKAFESEILAAQAKRATQIKAARQRFLQGLKFLNANPSLPQAMRDRINEEMKRIAALPEPDSPTIEPTKSPTSISAQRELSIRFNTPDSGWSVKLKVAKLVSNELWVLSELHHSESIASMVITPVEDWASVEASSTLPLRHFVLNKTWNWPNDEPIQFVRSITELGPDWARGKVLRMKSTDKLTP